MIKSINILLQHDFIFLDLWYSGHMFTENLSPKALQEVFIFFQRSNLRNHSKILIYVEETRVRLLLIHSKQLIPTIWLTWSSFKDRNALVLIIDVTIAACSTVDQIIAIPTVRSSRHLEMTSHSIFLMMIIVGNDKIARVNSWKNVMKHEKMKQVYNM